MTPDVPCGRLIAREHRVTRSLDRDCGCHLFVSKANAKQTHVVICTSPSILQNRKTIMLGQRNATDIVTEKHEPFDHLATVVQPFETEGSRDIEFQLSTRTASTIRDSLTGTTALEINKALLDLVLEFHAWAAAKPAREHERTTEFLEKEVNLIIEKEKAQGRCSLPPRSCVGTRYIVQTISPCLLVPYYTC